MDEKEKLIKLYEDASYNILNNIRDSGESIANNQRSKLSLLSEISDIITILQGDSTALILKVIEKAYIAGSKEALSRMTTQGAKNLEASFKARIHREAVQSITDDAFYNVLEATNYMSQDVKNRLEDIIKSANRKSLVEGMSRKNATQQAVQEATQTGITGIVTSNGSQVPVDKYLSSSISYNQRKAHVDGSINRMSVNGQDLLYVNSVGITCAMCAQYQGRVYSISGKDSRFPPLTLRPPYHGHCVHSTYPWNEDYESPPDVKQMLQESNRPFKDNRTETNIKKYKERQNKMSKKNSARKQWIQYKSRMPDLPDLKTFASHKSRNTKLYQEWVSDHRLLGRRIATVSKAQPLKLTDSSSDTNPLDAAKARKAAAAKLRRQARKAKAQGVIDIPPPVTTIASPVLSKEAAKKAAAKARREARKAKALEKPDPPQVTKKAEPPKVSEKEKKAAAAKARREARKAKAKEPVVKKPNPGFTRKEIEESKKSNIADINEAIKSKYSTKGDIADLKVILKEYKDGKWDHATTFLGMSSRDKYMIFEDAPKLKPKTIPQTSSNGLGDMGKIFKTEDTKAMIKAIDQMPPELKKIFNKYGDEIRIKTDSTGSFYRGYEKTVHLSNSGVEKEARGQYTVIFHEVGHFFDDKMGKLSFSPKYKKAIQKDYQKLLDEGRERLIKRGEKKIFDDMLYANVGYNVVRLGHKTNGIQDVLGGISLLKVDVRYGHSLEYWTRRDHMNEVGNELFAHMFAAGADPEKQALMKQHFPTAWKEFLSMLDKH